MMRVRRNGNFASSIELMREPASFIREVTAIKDTSAILYTLNREPKLARNKAKSSRGDQSVTRSRRRPWWQGQYELEEVEQEVLGEAGLYPTKILPREALSMISWHCRRAYVIVALVMRGEGTWKLTRTRQQLIRQKWKVKSYREGSLRGDPSCNGPIWNQQDIHAWLSWYKWGAPLVHTLERLHERIDVGNDKLLAKDYKRWIRVLLHILANRFYSHACITGLSKTWRT